MLTSKEELHEFNLREADNALIWRCPNCGTERYHYFDALNEHYCRHCGINCASSDDSVWE